MASDNDTVVYYVETVERATYRVSGAPGLDGGALEHLVLDSPCPKMVDFESLEVVSWEVD